MPDRTLPHTRRRAGQAVVAGLLAAIAGCATERPRAVQPAEKLLIQTELAAGLLRLNCGSTCSASWQVARPTLRGLYDNRLWPDLAVEVARIGHDSDLAYFYLARAAEATGSPRAAELYFRLSRASTTRCDGWVFDRCDGVRLPDEATAGLARVGAR